MREQVTIVRNCRKWVNMLTYISLAFFYGTQTNSADPDQTPHNGVSDLGLHYLLIE